MTNIEKSANEKIAAASSMTTEELAKSFKQR